MKTQTSLLIISETNSRKIKAKIRKKRMTELQTLAATSGASSLPDVDFHRVELLICVLFAFYRMTIKIPITRM